jgi:hypothetical protein
MIEAMLFFLFVVGVIWLCLRDRLFRRAVAIFFKWAFLIAVVLVAVGYGIYVANEGNRAEYYQKQEMRYSPMSSYEKTR